MLKKAKADKLINYQNILVVDDEEHVGLYIEILLSNRGYHVSRCKNGKDALDLFMAGEDRFDLIITDQNMPVMSGAELSKQILEINPAMPIILCTGYGYDNIIEITKEIAISAHLSKPLKANELIGCIEGLLHVGPDKIVSIQQA